MAVKLVSMTNGMLLLAEGGISTGSHVTEVSFWGVGSGIRIGKTVLWLEYEPEESERRRDLFGLIGDDAAIDRVRQDIVTWSADRFRVLIHGESGSGKELVARGLHDRSPRHENHFIARNCATLVGSMLEDDLFGHVKNAFTGAVRERKGAFELADRCTLFLDEIGELPPETQVKLLRVLETGEVFPVGSSTPIKVDVRLICASHRDLRKMVKEGKFREDLYHRIADVTIEVPPLRERPGDIPLLVRHYTSMQPNGGGVGWTPRAMEMMQEHPFTGNVRELISAVKCAVQLATGGFVEPEHLRRILKDMATDESSNDTVGVRAKPLKAVIRETIVKSIRRNGGNKNAAARELKTSRSVLTPIDPDHELEDSESSEKRPKSSDQTRDPSKKRRR
ncbi:MAG: sigma-54-dependent Fis family transcriptional regulator [Deltaproteobacteria bacterium]|nr:sigma-54-dependent Fis family transcriptional regulator [Deltaproteobacteria bacterium]